MSGARAWRVVPAALAAAWLAAAPLGASAAGPVNGSARFGVSGGWTSSAFPGYPGSTPDRFVTLAASAGARVQPRAGTRIEWLAGAALDRNRSWIERDAERYETELRARSGPWRLRARGRLAPDLVLFPDALGGARYRDREGLLGLDWRFAPPLVATMEARREDQHYDLQHGGRTQARTRFGWQLAFESGPRRASLAFENERARALDSNYDFWRNQLTLAAADAWGPVELRAEGTIGLRNYFPASIFATNFRRQDRERALRVDVVRHLGDRFDLVAGDELQARDSTRPDRGFRVHTIHLSLDRRLGR